MRRARLPALLIVVATAGLARAQDEAAPWAVPSSDAGSVAWSAGVEGFATLGTLDRVIGGARAGALGPAGGHVQVLARGSVFLNHVEDQTNELEVRADLLAFAFPSGGSAGGPYAFALALYTHDHLRRLDDRLVAGVGVGWRTPPGPARLAVSAAPVVEASWFADGAERRRPRLSLRAVGARPLSDAVTLSAEVLALPPLDPTDVLTTLMGTLDVALAPRLSLTVTLRNTYESRPPTDVEPNDARLTVGVRVRA